MNYYVYAQGGFGPYVWGIYKTKEEAKKIADELWEREKNCNYPFRFWIQRENKNEL